MKTVSFALAKISKHINITAEKYLLTACIEHLREDHLPVTRGPDTNHSTDFQKTWHGYYYGGSSIRIRLTITPLRR